MREQRRSLTGLSDTEFQVYKLILNAGAFRLFIGSREWTQMAWHTDFRTNELVLRWKEKGD